MFSYILGYLDTPGAHALLDRKLREVDDDPESRFCTLKKRFREHYELLEREKGFGDEIIQHMIDILGTDGNYEEMLVRVVTGNTKAPTPFLSRLWSKFVDSLPLPSISDKPSKTTLNGYKLDQVDDTTFLTEICAIATEKPPYGQIVDEILQEATKSLSIKLKKLEKELINLVRKHVAHIIKQETNERVDIEKGVPDQAAKARLRSLIRETLDAEVDHPTNR